MRAQLALVALAFGSLLFYVGIGVVKLLAFERIRGGEIVLAPCVGAAVLVTVGSWSGTLGWSAGVALVLALTAATIVNLVSLRSGPLRVPDVRGSLGGMSLALLVVAVGVAPLWTLDRPATVVGLNGDQVFYTNIASYLERHGLPVPAPGPLEPAAAQRALFDSYGVPLGFSSVHAMVDRLTGLPAYGTFSVVTAVFLALNALACAFLAERLFGLGRRWALAAGFLVAVSPALMWIHYNNYAMHALSMGLAPAAFGVAILALGEGRGRGLALAALLLSALSVSYPPGAGPFVLAPLGVYALLLVRGGTSPAGVIRRGVILGLSMLALNLGGFLHVAKVLRPMVQFVLVREFGDVTSHVSPAQLFGFIHHALPAPPGWLTPLIAGLTAAAALLTLYGAAGSTTEGRRAFLALVVGAVPLVLWLRFGLDYPYGFYKGLTFLVWPAIIGLVLGVRRAGGAPAIVKASALALLLVLAAASTANLLRTAQAVTVFDLAPMMGLRALDRLAPRNQAIHVRDESGTALLWITFFLQDRPLYLGNSSPYYVHDRWPFYQETITAPLVLVNRDAVRLSPWDAGTVYENRRYRVARKNPAILAYLDFSAAPRPLDPDQEIRVGFRADRTIVDGRSFAPGLTNTEARTVALGLWTVSPSTMRVRLSEGERELRVHGDRDLVSWPVSSPPSEAVIVNAGAQTALVPGWIAVVDHVPWPEVSPASAEPLTILRDEVLPGSGFFTVSGWHGPEGPVRWSRASGVAVFRNPQRRSSLRVDCLLWRPGLSTVTRLAVLVNGQSVGPLVCSGKSREVFALSEAILGRLSWGMLEIRVDPVFVPKAGGVSADGRDLGVLVRGLGIEPDG